VSFLCGRSPRRFVTWPWSCLYPRKQHHECDCDTYCTKCSVFLTMDVTNTDDVPRVVTSMDLEIVDKRVRLLATQTRPYIACCAVGCACFVEGRTFTVAFIQALVTHLRSPT
jgi:hypothetical protein